MTAPIRSPLSSRQRLLDTSADLFWTRGYRATTTRQIAAVMGLQQASLYHHVSSKEDLLCEICRTALEELSSAAHASVDGATAPERCLEPLICALLRTELSHQKAHATMAFELRSISPNRQTPLRASAAQPRAARASPRLARNSQPQYVRTRGGVSRPATVSAFERSPSMPPAKPVVRLVSP